MLVQESNLCKINGTTIPAPASLSVSWEDVHTQNSGRAMDAKMKLTIIARKRKVQVKYEYLAQEEMQKLQALLHGTYYTFDYYDPEYGVHQITAYVSSAAQDLYSAILYDGVWQNVSFNVIEV